MTQTDPKNDENALNAEESLTSPITDQDTTIEDTSELDDQEVNETSEAQEVDPFAVIQALQTENQNVRDKLLRALAETENTRRRAIKDVADARAYGISSFARDMLEVVDNLHRAIEALPAEASQQGNPLKSFHEGIELTERHLLTTLEKHGVKKLNPLGEKFDPHFHQAVFEVPDAEVPAGHVAVVVQTGFTIGERVLRPAMVGISKGAPNENS